MVDKGKCPYSAVYESNEALCVDLLLRQLWLYGLVVAFSVNEGWLLIAVAPVPLFLQDCLVKAL